MEANKYDKLSLDKTTRTFFFHKLSKRHYNEPSTMKTTTNAGKNAQIEAKMREDCVEAIQTVSVSLKTLYVIH